MSGGPWAINYIAYDPDPYINLSAAILRQAYFDYIDRLLGVSPYRCSSDGSAINSQVESLEELEAFFSSDYCRRISFGTNEEIARRAFVHAHRIIAEKRPKGTHRSTFYIAYDPEAFA